MYFGVSWPFCPATNMPLPPTYSASHHHIFQEAMTAPLSCQPPSCPRRLRKPRPFSRPTSNLLSIMISIQPLNNCVIQTIMTPPPPRSPPTPTTTRLTTVFRIFLSHDNISFRLDSQLFSLNYCHLFSTRSSHLFSLWCNYCLQIKEIPTNPLQTYHFQRTHFQQTAIYFLSSALLSSFPPTVNSGNSCRRPCPLLSLLES